MRTPAASDLVLRPPRPGEASALANLHGRSFATGWAADAFETLIAWPGMIALVAARQEALLGLILVRVAADEGEIVTLAVDPDARRQGLGRALTQTAMALAASTGARQLFLEAAVENTQALALYAALGFEPVGLRRGYYGRTAAGGGDARVLRRDLTP